MPNKLETIKDEIGACWLSDLARWLGGGSMQGHLIYTNDSTINCNEFLRQLYEETLKHLRQNEFRLKCRPAYISVKQASQLNTEGEVKRYLADVVASPEIWAGVIDVKRFDYRPLFFIENLDVLIARVDNLAEQAKRKGHDWTGMQSSFKEASDTGRFNVVLTAADYLHSVFTDGRAGPFLIYYAHELKK